MGKTCRVVLGLFSSLSIFCVAGVVPGFCEWSYRQIDPDCDIIAMWSITESATQSDIYAGGYKTDGTYSGCVYHNDGTDWQPINVTGLGPVFDIWGSARDDIYVVGLGFGAGRYHFDGTNWTQISSITGRTLWGFSAEDVFIGGRGIDRYQGAAWQTMFLPSDVSFSLIEGIWGTSSEDLYAVGNEYNILYYDGNPEGQWEHFDTTGLEEDYYGFSGIWGNSDQDIFVIGRAAGKNIILHYDGSLWTTFVTPLSDGDTLMSIWGTGPDDVYAASYDGYILHYDGMAWSVIQSSLNLAAQLAVWRDYQLDKPADMPGQVNLNAVCGSSASSVYFAGDNGVVLHHTPAVAACVSDEECEDDLFCTGAETCAEGLCVSSGDPCASSGLLCDEDQGVCGECFTDDDCMGDWMCRNGACVSPCELSIDYRGIYSTKLRKPKKYTLKISGGADFDTSCTVGASPLRVLKVKAKKSKNSVRVRVLVPAGLEPQVIPVSVGECYGTVEVR